MLRSLRSLANIGFAVIRFVTHQSLSTSAVRSDLARMQVLGRLAADPEVKTTKTGKDYVRYTVATSDPPTGPAENGEFAPTTTSYHKFYVFGDRGVDRMKSIKKGYRVLVDAEFRIERSPAEGDLPAKDTLLALHRKYKTAFSRPGSRTA